MTGIEVLFSVLSGALGAVGSIAQASAQKQAADYNAKVLQQQAVQRQEAANAQASDYRRSEHRKLATSQAARGATGVVATAGSPLLVDEATVREIALGSARYGYEGQVEKIRLQNEAELEKMKGKNAMTAGYIGAGTSLLAGFGSAFT